LRFHDLRHRYASVLIEAGLDALTIKKLMGHSSITETYDTYGHLFPSQPPRR
jgi:integrase